MVLILIYELPLLFYYLCDWIVYEQFFWVKIQDVFSLVSIDEFTSAVRGYKNSLDERFLRELSVPDRIGKNHQLSEHCWLLQQCECFLRGHYARLSKEEIKKVADRKN